MAKKRKPNLYQQNKIEQAQRKNEFLAKAKWIINTATGKKIYELFPKASLDKLYDLRSYSLLINTDENIRISNESIKIIKKHIHLGLKYKKIKLLETSEEITLNEYFTVYLSICCFSKTLNESLFTNAKTVMAELQVFADFEKMFYRAYDELSEYLKIISDHCFDFHSPNLCFSFDSKLETKNLLNVQCAVTIKIWINEIAHVKINNESRPVFRVGFPSSFTDINWISIKPYDLNIQNTFAQIPLDVYIQSHAINRLRERLDCISDYGIMALLEYSLAVKPKMCYDIHKNMMIEFRMFDVKTGYLPFEITDGKIVIKTFLFITSSSTPEGAMLEKYTGLNKEDIKYLKIDKLSSFANSDISENKELQTFLKKAGCECLIELYKYYKNSLKNKGNPNNLNKMMEMMNKNKEYLKECEMLVIEEE